MISAFPKGPYNIISISWSSPLAFEVGKYIEKLGKNVSIFVIDGALKTLQRSIKETKFTKEKLIAKILMSEEVSFTLLCN